jgi:hypothetical protein
MLKISIQIQHFSLKTSLNLHTRSSYLVEIVTMTLDPLSNLGLFLLVIMEFLTFLIANLSATSSWHMIELSKCVETTGFPATSTSFLPYRNGGVKLYVQPGYGVCGIANAMSSGKKDCYTWSETSLWSQWETITGTKPDANEAISTVLPKVNKIAIATIFFALFPLLLTVFHYFKPDTLGKRVNQLLCSIFFILVLIFSGYMPATVNNSVISNSSNWKSFYTTATSLACSVDDSSMYIGGGLAVLNIFLSFFSFMMCMFPTFFGMCNILIDSSGSSASGGEGNGDMKSSLVDNDGQSQYVPPTV